jgi:dTDP-4-amino-4,6-dideoxygalactose transaminase
VIDLPLADDGLPAWPPRDPAIWQSLQQLFASGQWGRYQSTVSAECVHAIEQMLAVQVDASSLPKPWCGFQERINAKGDVRLCSSGTMAVELALRGCDVRAGDEVVVAAYDYPGNFRSVELLGATPVLADVLPDRVTMDPASLRQITGEKIKAVVVSHLYGELAEMWSIRDICDARGWYLIEDACQVPGANWRVNEPDQPASRLPIGVLSDCMTLSFGGSKLLSAGNGGALVSRTDRIAARVRAYVERPSDAVPLSPLQAAVLLPQLALLDELNERRQLMAAQWRLHDWSSVGATVLTTTRHDEVPAYYKFALLALANDGRAELMARLQSSGWPVGVGFRSMHGTSERRSRKPVSLENSRLLGDRCIVIDHRALLAESSLELPR